jgi:translation elongation factor EF-G
MDKIGADFMMVVNDIRQKLGVTPAIMCLPIGQESDFKGIVLLIERQAIIWEGDETGAKYKLVDIPAEMKDQVEEYRAKLVEQISETNDDLTEKFLNGEDITNQEVKISSPPSRYPLRPRPHLLRFVFTQQRRSAPARCRHRISPLTRRYQRN